LVAYTTYYLEVKDWNQTMTGSYTITATRAVPTVSLDKRSWSPYNPASSDVVTVFTNQSSWSAWSNQSWLTMSRSTGGNQTQVTVYAAENTGINVRTGVITFTAGDATVTYTVTQAGAPQGTVNLDQRDWRPNKDASNVLIRVFTNQPQWTAWSDQTWLTMSWSTGGDQDLVFIYAAANPSTSPRTGHVTFTAGGASVQLTVTQAASTAPPSTISLSQTSWRPPVGGGWFSLYVYTNQPEWVVTTTLPGMTVSPPRGGNGAYVSIYIPPNRLGIDVPANVIFSAGTATAILQVTQSK